MGGRGGAPDLGTNYTEQLLAPSHLYAVAEVHTAEVVGLEQRFWLQPIVGRGRVWSLRSIKLTTYENKTTKKSNIVRGT